MEPLAQPSDLDVRIIGGLPEADFPRARALLTDVSAAVRGEARQQFTAGTTTLLRVKVRAGIARLPQRPVTAVAEVLDDADNAVAFTWLGDDRLRLGTDAVNAFELEPYRNPLGEVRVTYDHGYEADAIPDLVVAIVCNATLRALGRDPKDGALMQESVDGYSYQTGSVGAAGGVGLLPEEKLRLADFARPRGMSRQ